MPAHNAKDLTGQRFGRLTAVKRGPTQGKKATWLCRCDCGGEKLVQYWSLVANLTRSCGCLWKEHLKTPPSQRTHGLSKTALYRIWLGMKSRCLNPKSVEFKYYGGRGITICERWLNDFEAFKADIGPRPSPQHTVDRRDNDGPYSPDNCHWATKKQQAENRRNSRFIEAFGKRLTARDWAKETGIKPSTIYMRVFERGWPVERALSEPTHG